MWLKCQWRFVKNDNEDINDSCLVCISFNAETTRTGSDVTSALFTDMRVLPPENNWLFMQLPHESMQIYREITKHHSCLFYLSFKQNTKANY